MSEPVRVERRRTTRGEGAAAPSDSPNDLFERRVAVLIVVVTMLGSVVAYLQTQAGNREGRADRRARAAAVGSMTSVGEANRMFTRQTVIQDLFDDQRLLGDQLQQSTQGGSRSAYAAALGRAHAGAAAEIARYANPFLGVQYVTSTGSLDIVRFIEDGLKLGYRDAEREKAHARERDGWGSKGKYYVTSITVLAFALFLLGLALTVPGSARTLFVSIACVVALATTVSVLTIWARSVERPRTTAIDAYVEGQAKVDVADFLLAEPARSRALAAAVGHFTRAIRARPWYQEAYVARGSTLLFLDLANPGGPQGSEAARADLTEAVLLDGDDFVAWANLGAVLFWLGDYDAALSATDEALRHGPNDPILAMNRALFLLANGRDSDYRRQLPRVGAALVGASTWLRTRSMDRYAEVIRAALRHRPELREEVEVLRDDFHEIEASIRTRNEAMPHDVGATMTGPRFVPGTGGALTASFAHRDVPPGSRWLYDAYADGKRVHALSAEPMGWQFETPDGGFDITFPNLDSFVRDGAILRVEVFLEGKLMAAGEHRVSHGDSGGS